MLPVDAASRRLIRGILRRFEGARRLLVSTHVRPDGDAIGSTLAVARFLRRSGKRVDVCIDGGVPEPYRFLKGAERVQSAPGRLRGRHELAVVIDCGALDRLERVQESLDGSLPIINIDHHQSNTRFGELNWVDTNASCVGNMIYKMICEAGGAVDREMAVALYVALVTDTGRFSFSNTDRESHQLAAELLRLGARPAEVHQRVYCSRTGGELKLAATVMRRVRTAAGGRVAWAVITRRMIRQAGAEPLESQHYITVLRELGGVKVAVLFREMGNRKVKVSFRCARGIDAVRLAGAFGGGGHPRASGCTLEGQTGEVVERVLGAVRRALRRTG